MGTRCRKSDINKLSKDHPHAYGDKRFRYVCLQQCLGSSPRVWGQVDTGNVNKGSQRIIPTRMGTRSTILDKSGLTVDHPHAYGDKAVLEEKKFIEEGSSPRVWGQAETTSPSAMAIRIIPTRMGTSMFSFLILLSHKDHPHAYGDKYGGTVSEFSGFGSSPRVWGQVFPVKPPVTKTRIIPTRMGTRLYLSYNIIPRKWIIPTRMGTSLQGCR